MYPRARLVFVSAALLAFCLAPASLSGQARILETRSAPLAGPALTPSLSAEPEPLLLEDYDAKGRLILLGRPGGGEGGTAGSGSTRGSFREFRYDRKGRIVLMIESDERAGPPQSTLKRLFDGDDRLAQVELWEEEALSARLEIGYEGSGHAGYAWLRSGEGELLEAATFVLGGGAAAGAILSLELEGAGGEPQGGLLIDYDSAGRLTGYEWMAPELEAPGGEGMSVAPRADGGSAGAKEPSAGLVDLLLPFWPGEAPSFQLASLMALGPGSSPSGAASPFSMGLAGPPFDRPREGRAEFLYDKAGRLLFARLFGPPRLEGSPDAPAREILAAGEYRYDETGLLVEERRSVGPEVLLLLHVYRIGESGAWSERSSFVRDSESGLVSLQPLEYRSRR